MVIVGLHRRQDDGAVLAGFAQIFQMQGGQRALARHQHQLAVLFQHTVSRPPQQQIVAVTGHDTCYGFHTAWADDHRDNRLF